MKPQFKKCIDSITPYVPGKPIDEVKRELGLTDIIKVASNENVLGVSARVKDKLIEAINDVHVYPDGGCWRLREKLAAYLGVDSDEIVFGNGSNEIIEFIAKGFIDHGDEVISSQYAFLVYPLLTQVCDGVFKEVPTKNFEYDLAAIADAVTDKTRVIFLANPNNPTGTYFSRDSFEAFIERVPEHIVICLDEAYVDFVEADDYPNGVNYFRRGNIVVLRTFSKSFGIAGLRVGYGLASKEMITYFNKIRQPFNVNALAQCAAAAVLDDTEYLRASQECVRVGKRFFYCAFEQMELEYLPSQTNFVLVNVGVDSKVFFEECLRRGVILRDMKAYGLDTFVRITMSTEEENRRIISVMKEILNK